MEIVIDSFGRNDCWVGLNRAHVRGKLQSMLFELLIATHENRFTPTVTPELVALAKEELNKDDLLIGNQFYYVAVCKADDPADRSFFVLVRRYLGGTVKRLEEL